MNRLLEDRAPSARPLMRVLAGERLAVPPVWMMRQAGRYLPEYRALRARHADFLAFCYTPQAAAEATLQPVSRFGLDAAILFSDILVVPDALGRKVAFGAGEGPRLEPLDGARDIARLDPGKIAGHLAPVYETVARVCADLPQDTALLGFCGAPWTVATYMVAGRGGEEQRAARLMAYREPEAFGALIDVLVEASADHLARQLEAGADAVQVFDTWAGVLDEAGFRRWSIEPTRRIVAALRARVPGARVIGFPRGAGVRAKAYFADTRVDALGLDWTMPLGFARDELQALGPVQGNLDPLALLAGGAALEEGVERILESLGPGPLIFNLGHGILPQTPVSHVEAMLKRVRARPA